MIRKRRVTCAFLAAIVMAVAFTSTSGAYADPDRPAGLTDRQIAVMSPAQQAELLDPLRAVANALDTVGRSTGADVYSGVELDANTRAVNLYLTDLGRVKTFLDAAKKTGHSANLDLVRVRSAKYSRKDLNTARDRVEANLTTSPVTIDNAIVPANGSGLILGVEQPTAVATADISALSDTAGVEVRVTQGRTLTGADRYNDSPPYAAGSFIVDNGYACTTGIPVKNNNGQQFIVTASHCGHTGTHWVTGGNREVGHVVRYDERSDAALIATESAAYLWETNRHGNEFRDRFYGTALTYKGDIVHHNGFPSRTVYSIKVDDVDVLSFQVRGPRYGDTFSATGIIGHQTTGGQAVQGGDSGGLVFAIKADTKREVRGIVSASVDGTNGNSVFFTEAPAIYHIFNVHLTDRI